jgi:Ni,Fe-hydrogenase III large subunit
MNAIGGLRKDVSYEQLQDIEATMDQLEPKFLELQRIVRKDITLRRRLRGIGLLTKKDAMDWCTVGPTSRGSGLPHDVRLTGYGGYGLDGIRFRPVYYEEGDCYARTMVRMDEVIQAVDLIRQALGSIRDGPVQAPVKGHPNGEAYGRVEAPRGELLYYVKANGTTMLDRIKLRTPALVNIPALTAMVPGCRFADVAVITVSVDPCVCCTDR